MPTGYTAAIADGITFQDFAIKCARAFGALITMRDDPMDAPIQEFKPNDYYAQALEAARLRVSSLNAMTPEQAEAQALRDYLDATESHHQSKRERNALNAKYEAMLIEVRAWAPPSPDHVGLQKFMVEQIEMSMDTFELQAPQRMTGPDWLAAQLDNAERHAKFSEKNYADEVARTASSNLWVKQLRESLRPALT